MDAAVAYQRYLESPHWADVRERARKSGARCIITGSTHFTLHHLNYENLGAEVLWEDVIPLDWELHKAFHDYADAHGLKHWEVLRWVAQTRIVIRSEIRERLEHATTYNRRLAKGKIRPRKGRRNIFEPEKTKQTQRRTPRGNANASWQDVKRYVYSAPRYEPMQMPGWVTKWIAKWATPKMLISIGACGDTLEAMRLSLKTIAIIPADVVHIFDDLVKTRKDAKRHRAMAAAGWVYSPKT